MTKNIYEHSLLNINSEKIKLTETQKLMMNAKKASNSSLPVGMCTRSRKKAVVEATVEKQNRFPSPNKPNTDSSIEVEQRSTRRFGAVKTKTVPPDKQNKSISKPSSCKKNTSEKQSKHPSFYKPISARTRNASPCRQLTRSRSKKSTVKTDYPEENDSIENIPKTKGVKPINDLEIDTMDRGIEDNPSQSYVEKSVNPVQPRKQRHIQSELSYKKQRVSTLQKQNLSSSPTSNMLQCHTEVKIMVKKLPTWAKKDNMSSLLCEGEVGSAPVLTRKSLQSYYLTSTPAVYGQKSKSDASLDFGSDVSVTPIAKSPKQMTVTEGLLPRTDSLKVIESKAFSNLSVSTSTKAAKNVRSDKRKFSQSKRKASSSFHIPPKAVKILGKSSIIQRENLHASDSQESIEINLDNLKPCKSESSINSSDSSDEEDGGAPSVWSYCNVM